MAPVRHAATLMHILFARLAPPDPSSRLSRPSSVKPVSESSPATGQGSTQGSSSMVWPLLPISAG